MRRFRYVIADVFTDVPLAGNQLAVFTDARDLDPLTMQTLARETNLSETVFVLPPSSDDADVRIRIFTPANELPFAGHPTLGAAFVLGGPLSKIVIRIETARRDRARRADAGRPADRLRPDGAADPGRGSRSRTPRRSSPRSRSRAPGCRSSGTTSARATSTSSSARQMRWRRCGPT